MAGQHLPILLHCRDDQGRPLLGPLPSGRETRGFLRNAHTDIPAAVEAVRQYWMPMRYPRARCSPQTWGSYRLRVI